MIEPRLANRLADATDDEDVLAIAATAAVGLVPAGMAVAAIAAVGTPLALPETWLVKAAQTPDGHRWARRLRQSLASVSAMKETAVAAGLALFIAPFPAPAPDTGLLALLLPANLSAGTALGGAALQQAMDDLASQAGLALRALDSSRRLARAEAEQHTQQQFLSIAAHDLRTPLAAIRGYAQLLLRRTGSGETPHQRASLQTIVQQTDRLAALTEMVLDVARIQTRRMALRRVTTDLGQVVREAAGVVNGQPGPGQPPPGQSPPGQSPPGQPGVPRVRLMLPESGPVLNGDTTRLTQIARALLEFGMRRSGADQPVEVRLAAEDGGAVLIVDDAGPRLTAREREDLFHRLVVGREDGHSPALGQLGLYIARGAAEAHGGRVWAESPVPQRQKGVRLGVWLPAGDNGA